MQDISLVLTSPLDNLCDYTFNFHYLNQKLDPESQIPDQTEGSYTYLDLVDGLKNGADVHIKGDVGERLAFSMGVDLKHLGGTGKPDLAGRIFVDGNVGAEVGMGMVAGMLYVSGTLKEPLGNIIEVASDEEGYRKFRSITDIMCNGPGEDTPVSNSLDEDENILTLSDGILRGTIGARMDCRGTVVVEGDAYNGTGLLMRRGTVHVKGSAGMNTGSRLDGGTVVVSGIVDEFAGAYMKSGNIVINDAKGYVGANMTGGAIFSKKKVSLSPPATPGKKSGDNSKMLRRVLDAGRLEAMLYNKYEVGSKKDECVKVHMRDGSVIMRKVDNKT
ncbi:MAG: formylmethanofuran dehydrogenase [ANME-2 cluster archaeon]|jgi:formylmethanofuran dehydrogenase subunit C|nr:formylmethanofuran dehydrogenase [ANME-2 cluster archaeon]